MPTTVIDQTTDCPDWHAKYHQAISDNGTVKILCSHCAADSAEANAGI